MKLDREKKKKKKLKIFKSCPMQHKSISRREAFIRSIMMSEVKVMRSG
jgi:hypothetical protein